MVNDKSMINTESLPSTFRIVSFSCMPSTQGSGVIYRLKLYHPNASVTVAIGREHPDKTIEVNKLASVWWKNPRVCIDDVIQVTNLWILQTPNTSVDLFKTVPPSWGWSVELLAQIKELLGRLPKDMQILAKAILWDARRFRLFYYRCAIIKNTPYRIGMHLSDIVLLDVCGLEVGECNQAEIEKRLTEIVLREFSALVDFGCFG